MSDQSQEIILDSPHIDDKLLWNICMSQYHLPVVLAADELGIFTTLGQGVATTVEIAENLDLSLRGTQIVLNLLSALGFLAQSEKERFCLTEVSQHYLLPGSAYYWGGLLSAERKSNVLYTRILESLRRGQETLQEPEKLWVAYDQDKTQVRLFTQRMHDTSLAPAMSVARQGDFKGVSRLLDVAGGSGCYSIALSMRYPDLRCTLVDLSTVCQVAKEYIDRYNCEDQVDTRAMNIFEDPWPTGYDAVFFSRVFQDWDQEHNRRLAHSSFEILPSGGRIYLHEMLVNDTKDGPIAPMTHSVKMFTLCQGEQRTSGELAELLRECGFEEIVTTPTHGYYSLLMAKKP